MTTMREIVNDAFEDIAVKKAETALESDELQSGIRRANDMLAQWNDLGIIVGYNAVTDADAEVELEPSAIAAAKAQLAIRLAPSYSRPITSALATNAKIALDMLRNANAYIGPVAYPDTLPIGSGNECPDSFLGERFFEDNKDENF
jgi:hypothetical protein